MNFPRLLFAITCMVVIGYKGDELSPTGSDEIRAQAKELAQKFILADTPVDLPCQLRIRNFRLDREFALAGSPEEVRTNTLAGKISLPMGMENDAPAGNGPGNVKYFFKRGIRYVTLTRCSDDHVCDPSYDARDTWNGLSPFGEKVAEEINRVGIMVDILHVRDSTFYDVLKLTKVPLIAPHSSCRLTPGCHRNMTDDMIRAPVPALMASALSLGLKEFRTARI